MEIEHGCVSSNACCASTTLLQADGSHQTAQRPTHSGSGTSLFLVLSKAALHAMAGMCRSALAIRHVQQGFVFR